MLAEVVGVDRLCARAAERERGDDHHEREGARGPPTAADRSPSRGRGPRAAPAAAIATASSGRSWAPRTAGHRRGSRGRPGGSGSSATAHGADREPRDHEGRASAAAAKRDPDGDHQERARSIRGRAWSPRPARRGSGVVRSVDGERKPTRQGEIARGAPARTEPRRAVRGWPRGRLAADRGPPRRCRRRSRAGSAGPERKGREGDPDHRGGLRQRDQPRGEGREERVRTASSAGRTSAGDGDGGDGEEADHGMDKRRGAERQPDDHASPDPPGIASATARRSASLALPSGCRPPEPASTLASGRAVPPRRPPAPGTRAARPRPSRGHLPAARRAGSARTRAGAHGRRRVAVPEGVASRWAPAPTRNVCGRMKPAIARPPERLVMVASDPEQGVVAQHRPRRPDDRRLGGVERREPAERPEVLDRPDVVRQHVDERHDRAGQLQDDRPDPDDADERGQRDRPDAADRVAPAPDIDERRRPAGACGKPQPDGDDDARSIAEEDRAA